MFGADDQFFITLVVGGGNHRSTGIVGVKLQHLAKPRLSRELQ